MYLESHIWGAILLNGVFFVNQELSITIYVLSMIETLQIKPTHFVTKFQWPKCFQIPWIMLTLPKCIQIEKYFYKWQYFNYTLVWHFYLNKILSFHKHQIGEVVLQTSICTASVPFLFHCNHQIKRLSCETTQEPLQSNIKITVAFTYLQP